MLRVSATHSDVNLAIELLTSKGVYVHLGHFYDLPTGDYLVLSLITGEQAFGEGTRGLLSLF